MGRVIASGKLGAVMVSTLAMECQEVWDFGCGTSGVIFPILIIAMILGTGNY